jgi:hypothetical protein
MNESDELRQLVEGLKERISELADENKTLRSENKELRSKIFYLEKENADLKQLLKATAEIEKEKPEFAKPNLHTHKKKPGREEGHEGAYRPMPEHIDEKKEAKLNCCPCCGGKIKKIRSRSRITEDVEPTKVKVTETDIDQYWCNGCKKIVEALVSYAFKNCRFGIRLYLLVAFMKIKLGMTIDKIRSLLITTYGLSISRGGIVQMLDRLAIEFGSHYKQLLRELRNSKYANSDETSWRIDGKNAWLWAFIGKYVAIYEINHSRGRNVPKHILGKNYRGTVSSDFWSAYNFVSDSHQKCHVHLKRELSRVAERKHHRSLFHRFKKKLNRILDDSKRLKEGEKDKEKLQKGKIRFETRVLSLCRQQWQDKDCKRIIKRLRRHATDLFTFLLVEGLSSDNNVAERSIRPPVIMRKNSYGSRSRKGAKTTAVLLSVAETCNLKNQNFLEWGQSYFEGNQHDKL